MVLDKFNNVRMFKTDILHTDFVIVGGGISGVCAAITAARQGLGVVLMQDRPVLGGNGSSEIRLWMLGATSHMGNNNRWAREGGIIDEIMVENTYRNPEGNPVIFDSILLDKVVSEPNITLLLNTCVYEVKKSSSHRIESVRGFCSQNSTMYEVSAPLFCDASGDGVVGFLSGGAYRMGAESREEFGEKFAPVEDYGELLGHSLYFYTKDTGKPVKYIAPSYALDVTKTVPRFRSFNTKEHGCKLWWVEYGGDLDTVHDTEQIKWELWKVIYGAWDYIKNSGKHPEAENMTLEWVGCIPGKRESRRFEGDYMLIQQDIIEQRFHEDAVSYGGWSIDLHPAAGVFGEESACNQWHSKGIYQIPYRCLYSKVIDNLFLAGRIISVSHVAFGSTRVMTTSAHSAQAVAMAATICLKENISPREVYSKGWIPNLQTKLLRMGQYIPNIVVDDDENLIKKATIQASSEFHFDGFPADGEMQILDESVAQMIPLHKGDALGKVKVELSVSEDTILEVELRVSSKPFNHTPDITIEKKTYSLLQGKQQLVLEFEAVMPDEQYAFLVFKKNPLVRLQYTQKRVTGILSVFNTINEAVSNFGKQTPKEDIGIEEFEFWCPKRRPEGHNIAIQSEKALHVFSVANIDNGVDRPVQSPNAWVADPNDPTPALTIKWDSAMHIGKLSLFFDTDYDHPMETVQMTHPENRMPFCVEKYKIYDDMNRLVYEKADNYQSINELVFPENLITSEVRIVFERSSDLIPVALFAVKCYE
ncbi:FAD-dependent oxidoreductase [Bacteroides sp.]|uniref:FAD-dependent oxidoreductase n=1 Tax=Bacteroides sp. TaxID=29523 RepID=UPI0025C29E2F|nr:FAD-dependent oxidoreductase [Bacteroides sp.]